MSVVFYAWLSAAEPERWPPDRAGMWVLGAFVFAIFFFAIFAYCIFSLISQANKDYRAEKNAT
jgi:hypothetical protein